MATKRNSNGNGSIYYDESRKRWRAQIKWTDKAGEKHVKKFVGSKKTEVKSRLDEFRRQLLISNGEISTGNVSFQEFANHWLTSSLCNKLKPTSYQRKEVTLVNQVYPHIGNIPIDQLTHTDVQNMVNELHESGLSYSTVKKAYEAVNGCLREYRIKAGSAFNPCEGISLPTTSERPISDIVFFNEIQRTLVRDESVRKYKTGKSVYRLGHSIIVLMYTGLRIGELLALKWADVDFVNKTISVDKNAVVYKVVEGAESHYRLVNQNSVKTLSGRRKVPLTDIAYQSLQELFKITGSFEFVMSSKNGKQVSPRNINRMFHSILLQTGIAKHPDEFCGVHVLRHTFASMLFKNECDIKVVSDLLGHSDTKVTENIYIHLIQDQKVKAIQDIDKYSDK